MVDLQKDALPSPVPSASPAPVPSARGQRLWAVLLVLDSLFVIVFGGALAAKVYQYWQAPQPPAAARRRTPPAKPLPPAPKAAEPSKPAEPPKPQAKAPEPKTPIAKPSLLNEPPRHEAAKPKESKKALAAPPPEPADAVKANKAIPVEFHFSAPNAQKVELSGAFIVRGNGRKKMSKQSDGTWILTLYLTPNKYRYHFLVDGKKTLDPNSPATDRGASVMTVGAP